MGARYVESAVGAHILNNITGTDIELMYWRDGNYEVDFVLRRGDLIVPLEVNSGRSRESRPGMDAFVREHKPRRILLVGGQGIPLEEFFLKPITHYLK